MPKNAPGRAICEVGFTRDIFGADVKLSGERVNELVDTFESLIGRRISVAVIEPTFNDACVVSESDERRVGRFDSGNGINEEFETDGFCPADVSFAPEGLPVRVEVPGSPFGANDNADSE